MAVIDLPEPVYAWLSRIACGVAAISNAIFLVLHIRAIWLQRKKKKNGGVKMNWSIIFSIIMQIFVVITSFGWIWHAFWPITDPFLCKFLVFLIIQGYLGAKWALYMFLSFRLDAAFKGSHYEYSKRTLYSWRAFLILAIIYQSIIALWTSDAEVVDEYRKWIPCRSILVTPVVMSLACIDTIACTVNLLMFTRKLRKVVEATHRSHIKLPTEHSNNITATDGASSYTVTTQTSSHVAPQQVTTQPSASSTAAPPKKKLFANGFQLPRKTSKVELEMAAEMQSVPQPSTDSTQSVPISASPRLPDSPQSAQSAQSAQSPKGSNSSYKKREDKFIGVIRKHTLLATISVGTTMLTLVFVTLFSMGTVWTSIDCICNVVTALLMFQWNIGYYNRFCKWCECLFQCESKH